MNVGGDRWEVRFNASVNVGGDRWEVWCIASFMGKCGSEQRSGFQEVRVSASVSMWDEGLVL